MMSLRTGPLYGLGKLLFSRRDSLLLLVPTRIASSSSESPALLRKLVRNSPNGCIVEHSHFVLKSLLAILRNFPIFPECYLRSQFSQVYYSYEREKCLHSLFNRSEIA